MNFHFEIVLILNVPNTFGTEEPNISQNAFQ